MCIHDHSPAYKRLLFHFPPVACLLHPVNAKVSCHGATFLICRYKDPPSEHPVTELFIIQHDNRLFLDILLKFDSYILN